MDHLSLALLYVIYKSILHIHHIHTCALYESDIMAKKLPTFIVVNFPLKWQYDRPAEQLGFCHTYHDTAWLAISTTDFVNSPLTQTSKLISFEFNHQGYNGKDHIKYNKVGVDLEFLTKIIIV